MRVQTFRRVAAGVAATSLIALAAPATAQSGPDFSFNIGAVSDYVFRGASQTDEDAAVQGGVDMTVGSFYAGVWASNVDFGDDTSTEYDVYGGFRTEAGGFAVDVGAVYYGYVDAPSFADYEYVEFKLAASRAIGPASVGAAAYYSPDFFGVDDQALYYEVNAGFSPMEKLTVTGAVGQQQLDVSDDYVTWNVGATYALTDNVAIDVRYHDTDVDGSPLYEDRVVAGLKLVY
jgi:uncharacterized protein (TIGR02001 family)